MMPIHVEPLKCYLLISIDGDEPLLRLVEKTPSRGDIITVQDYDEAPLVEVVCRNVQRMPSGQAPLYVMETCRR
jgi:hypothetical protein